MEWIAIIITSVVSIVSIFLSNYLGVKSSQAKTKYETQRQAYLDLYVPFTKWILSAREGYACYYFLVAVSRKDINASDNLEKMIKNHFEILPKDSAIKCQHYCMESSNAELFYSDRDGHLKYEDHAKNASNLFDQIVPELLEEGSRLANKLGYPDIPDEALKVYKANVGKIEGRQRYLPDIYRDHQPKVYIGPEPPYL